MTSDTDTPEFPLAPAMKPERPRDEFGRPLPAGSENRLDLPWFDEMSLDECHDEAIRLFDDGNYFGAHEAWETCWSYAKGTEEVEFFKGLAQLGAGYTHWMRGNPHGVIALLGRAIERIGAHGSPHRGLDIDAFLDRLEALRDAAARCEAAGTPLPELAQQPVPRA